ncbi:MAG: choice-of-anchor B family protein [Bacteroidia bacterium]
MRQLIFGILVMLVGQNLVAQDFELELVGQWSNDSLRDYKGQIFNDIWGWEDDFGREYVIMGSIDSTYFIDVTFPENPVICDVEAGKDDTCIHRDYKTYGNYCYAVADEGQSSLQIFDLSYLPDSVHKVYDSDELTRLSHNIFIDDGKAFLATNWHKKWGRIPMTILDITENPEEPFATNHLPQLKIEDDVVFNHVHDVFVRDNIAYCSNGSGGLFLYDIGQKDANGLKLVGQLTEYIDQGYNHASWLTDDDDYLIMADETHGMRLKMVDVKDFSQLQVVSTFGSNAELGSIPHNPFVVGDKCFVSYYHDGLVVFDISNPEDIYIADAFDTYPTNGDSIYSGYEGCWGVYPFFKSGLIAASDMSFGLFLFKTKNWDNPLVNNLETPSLLHVRLNNNVIDVQFNDAYDGQIDVKVFSIKGQLQQQYSQGFSGRYYKQNITPLSNGVYVVVVETEFGTEILKSVKYEK